MNQVFAGATALVITLLLWSLGKKPKGEISSEVNRKQLRELTNQEITFVLKSKANKAHPNQARSNISDQWEHPRTTKERSNLRKKLFLLIAAGPEERLKAVTIADQWGHVIGLPILRRGLKDSDSRVVETAAKALESHRGKSNPSNNQEEMTRRPPRNVALMR